MKKLSAFQTFFWPFSIQIPIYLPIFVRFVRYSIFFQNQDLIKFLIILLYTIVQKIIKTFITDVSVRQASLHGTFTFCVQQVGASIALSSKDGAMKDLIDYIPQSLSSLRSSQSFSWSHFQFCRMQSPLSHLNFPKELQVVDATKN